MESRPLATVTPQGGLAKGQKNLHGHLFLASCLSDEASTRRINI